LNRISGYLHEIVVGRPSLVCDFMEPYRYLVDDFVIQYCRKLQKKDFIMKSEGFLANRKGKREYLNAALTQNFVRGLTAQFRNKVKISRIRMGNSQEIETLIKEEAQLLSMYLRNEKNEWIPRVGTVK